MNQTRMHLIYSIGLCCLAASLSVYAQKRNIKKANRVLASKISEKHQPGVILKIDPQKSKAFVAGSYIEVYFFVQSNDIIKVVFNLPADNQPSLKIDVHKENANNVVRFTGPDIAQYVMPKGVSVQIPDKPEYLQKSALAGTIDCQNPPNRNQFPREWKIVVSLDGVDFGDNHYYKVEALELNAYPFPP